MTKTSNIVPKASMKTPWAIEVPSASVVTITRGPGSMQETSAAATIPPRNCAGRRKSARIQGTFFVKQRASVTWLEG